MPIYQCLWHIQRNVIQHMQSDIEAHLGMFKEFRRIMWKAGKQPPNVNPGGVCSLPACQPAGVGASNAKEAVQQAVSDFKDQYGKTKSGAYVLSQWFSTQNLGVSDAVNEEWHTG